MIDIDESAVDMSMSDHAWVDTEAACALLDVKPATLYSYVSRGQVRSRPGPGRSRRYARADLEQLVRRRDARRGHGPAAAGALAWGQPVLPTSVGTIDAGGPRYRDRSAAQLVREGATLEDVATVLWQREWSGPRRLRRFSVPARARGTAQRLGHAFVQLDAEEEARGVAPEAVMRRAIAALAADRERERRSLAAPSCAAALLASFGRRPSRRLLQLTDAALALAADHELNASTFTARVVASTGASLGACLGAALGALSGPAHGRASDRLEALLAQVGAPEHTSPVLRDLRSRGATLPGFGHPLYPAGDPRGALLLERSEGSRPPRALRTLRALVDTAEDLGLGAPNLDAGLVAARLRLGLPVGAAFTLFAVGRMVGWIAHVEEQRSQGGLLRPRARFVPGVAGAR